MASARDRPQPRGNLVFLLAHHCGLKRLVDRLGAEACARVCTLHDSSDLSVAELSRAPFLAGCVYAAACPSPVCSRSGVGDHREQRLQALREELGVR
eukprot:4938448-Prymnesium_polylepis.7